MLIGWSSRLLKAAVVVLAVCMSAVFGNLEEDRALTAAERRAWSGHRQHVRRPDSSNCSAVHQFAMQTMQYSNVLPITKRHGKLHSLSLANYFRNRN